MIDICQNVIHLFQNELTRFSEFYYEITLKILKILILSSKFQNQLIIISP